MRSHALGRTARPHIDCVRKATRLEALASEIFAAIESVRYPLSAVSVTLSFFDSARKWRTSLRSWRVTLSLVAKSV